MSVFQAVRNTILAGFGVQEKMKELVDELVKKGELSESQGAKVVREWTEKAEHDTAEFKKELMEFVANSIDKMKLPSREDIARLEQKIDELSERVKKLEEGSGH